MVVICLGPVCVPVYALLPVLMAVWFKVKTWVISMWTGAPPPNMECENGVCKMKAAPGEENPAGEGGQAKLTLSEWSSETKEVISVESEEQWRELLEESKSGKAMVVDFTAEWCKPCQKIKPFFKELCKEINSEKNLVKFVTVDVDELDSVAAECIVAAMPTFQAFVGGSKVDSRTGADEDKLRSMVEQVVNK